jgi:hypothetical protein
VDLLVLAGVVAEAKRFLLDFLLHKMSQTTTMLKM